MRRYSPMMIALVAVGLLGADVARAEEADGDAAEAQQFAASKVSLAQAIASAEAALGGKAISAEFRGDGASGGHFEVEIPRADGTVTYASVDPADGGVQATPMPRARDGHEDGEEDD